VSQAATWPSWTRYSPSRNNILKALSYNDLHTIGKYVIFHLDRLWNMVLISPRDILPTEVAGEA
jgi:hypothetical protein